MGGCDMQDGLTIDKHGLLGQLEPDGGIDGGDTVNWTGHWMYLRDEPPLELSYFIYAFRGGRFGFVRHPLSSRTASHYNNPWSGNISRDQLTGILATMVKFTNYKEALLLLLHHACWLFLFSYNTVRNNDDSLKWKWPDLTLFDIWAMELRMFGRWSYIFYPILCILDVHMLLSTIIFNRVKEDKDPISFALKSFVQIDYIPTPISLLSWRILNKDKLRGAIKRYWCGWRQNCGMYKLYRKKLGFP